MFYFKYNIYIIIPCMHFEMASIFFKCEKILFFKEAFRFHAHLILQNDISLIIVATPEYEKIISNFIRIRNRLQKHVSFL